MKFEKILVLSKSPSWRTRGLFAAAQHTGLDLEIPYQPYIDRELVEAFAKLGPEGTVHPLYGSAHAWLAHLDLVKYAFASNLDTVLIVEDDVDWDVTLKEQMRKISDAVRNFTEINKNDITPYGRAWDILWIGNCGEHTDPETPRIEWPDPTSPKQDTYTGWSQKYVVNLHPGMRAVQKGINPVCTYGYAMTRAGMQNVLEYAGKGQGEAYDIKLMHGCKYDRLVCVTITPEVMHQYTPPKEHGYISLVAEEDGKGKSVEEDKYESVMGATENIVNSTRCKVLFNSTCLTKEGEQ